MVEKMDTLTTLVSKYVVALLPIVGNCTAYPDTHDADRKVFDRKIYDAISAYGWPADLKGILAVQQAAESALDNDAVEGSERYVALVGIELACNARLASQTIQSDADCAAKLTWLRRELLGGAGEGGWIKALDNAIAWLAPIPSLRNVIEPMG